MKADRTLVTGAARGQGAAIVKRLHKDGFRIAACDLLADDLKATVEALGDDTRHPRQRGVSRAGRDADAR
jgi:NAD(P)-dependent dehydrogenase (short-subunit alcohol dehydrogenase family)